MAGRDDRQNDRQGGDERWQPRSRSERRAAERAAEREAQAAAESPPTTQLPRLSRRDRRPPPPPEPVHADEPDDVDEPAQPRRASLRFTLLLTLAALVPVAWATLCFVDTGQPYAVAATTLAPLLSVIALPVIALGVARRSVLPTLLALAAAIVPWALVAGSVVAGPSTTTASTSTSTVLHVMTVDGAAGRASATAIVAAARNYQIDVLVVTQLTSSQAQDLTTAGLGSDVAQRWVSIPAGKATGVGVWTKPTIGAAAPAAGVRQPSGVTTLTTTSGTVSLVVADLSGGSIVPRLGWRPDLIALSAASVTGPRILAGDLGGTVWSPVFRKLNRRGWYEAADVLGRGLRPTWPSWSPIPFSPLDQVMVGGGVGVSQAGAITIPGTTHRALVVTAVL